MGYIKVIGEKDRITKAYKKIRCHGIVFDLKKKSYNHYYDADIYTYLAKCKNVTIQFILRYSKHDSYYNKTTWDIAIKNGRKNVIEERYNNYNDDIYGVLSNIITANTAKFSQDEIEYRVRNLVQNMFNAQVRSLLVEKLNDPSFPKSEDNLLNKMANHAIIKDILE